MELFLKYKLQITKSIKLLYIITFSLLCMATGGKKFSTPIILDIASKKALEQESKIETTNLDNLYSNKENITVALLCKQIDLLPKGNISLNHKNILKSILGIVPHEDPLSIYLFNKKDDLNILKNSISESPRNKSYVDSIPMFSDIYMQEDSKAKPHDFQRVFEEWVVNGLDISYVPECYKTNDFFCRVVIREDRCFFIIPHDYLTAEICSAMCLLTPLNFSKIPERFKSCELSIECLKGMDNLTKDQQMHLINEIPEEYIAEASSILKKPIMQNTNYTCKYMRKKHIISDNISLDYHFGVSKKSLLTNSRNTNLNELSKSDKRLWYLNSVIADPIYQHSSVPSKYDEDEEFWKLAIKENGLIFLHGLPLHYLNEEWALDAIRTKINPICSYNLSRNERKIINTSIYLESLKKSLNFFNEYCMTPSSILDENLFLPFCFRNCNNLFSFTASNKFGIWQKYRLIEQYNKPDFKSYSFHKFDYSNIYNNLHPFNIDVPNPLLDELLYTCYSNVNTIPHASDIGEKLATLTDKFTKECEFAIINDEDYFNLQLSNIKVCGGRTCALEKDGKLVNYKFLRLNEDVNSFLREAAIHIFISQNDLVIKSGVPIFKSVFKINSKLVPKSILKDFKDKIMTVTIDQIDWYFGYCFETNPEYSVYAHVIDSASSSPFIKAEIGMENAAYDMGAWMCRGVFFPDIIPAFHDFSNKRTWLALPSLFNVKIITTQNIDLCTYAGTLNAWNTAATEMPDIGRCGLRDLGDNEIFPNLTQASSSVDKDCLHTHGVTTQVHMAEYVCKYIIAQVLLYGRLRQQSYDFHYKNDEALELTKQFFYRITASFLRGYKETAAHNTNNLSIKNMPVNIENFLNIGEHFIPCMQRMAIEIVYWLAKQPVFIDGDIKYDEYELYKFDPKDCYVQHLMSSADLSNELYTPYNIFQYTPTYSSNNIEHFVQKVFPHDFYNKEKNLSLGCTNGIFPLMTLMNVCQKFCTELFKWMNSF